MLSLNKIKFYILCFSLLCFSACATFKSINPFSEKDPSPKSADTRTSKLPFALEVNDEVNDGERLHILGAISAKTSWALDDVVVKLTGLTDGNIIGTSYLPLTKTQEKSSNSIKAGEKFSFSISIPSQNLTDYQIELLWGQDAKQYLATIAHLEPGTLELRNIQVETIQHPCQALPCEITFRVNAEIFNGTAKNIIQVILGTSYLRQKSPQELDLRSQIPQNEEQVNLGRILLEPGTSRSVRINFRQSVSSSELVNEDGELKPSLRIVSFQTE